MASVPGDHQAGPAGSAVRDRRRELGAFLRSRRARLSPAEVGLAVILYPATAADAAKLERLAG